MAQSETSEAFINPMSSYNLALDILKNMGMDPTRFLNDPATQEFQQAQQEAQVANTQADATKKLADPNVQSAMGDMADDMGMSDMMG